MTIRHAPTATARRCARSGSVWQSESAAPPPWADTSWEANESEFDRALAANGLFLAEENGEAVGFVVVLAREQRRLDRRPVRAGGRAPRRRGRALVEAVIENLRARGATHLLPRRQPRGARASTSGSASGRSRATSCSSSRCARSAPGAPSARSTSRPTISPRSSAPSSQFVPRLPGSSRGSIVSPPRGGWIAVYDDVCDRDPSMLRRLAQGALGAHGRRRALARRRARRGGALRPARGAAASSTSTSRCRSTTGTLPPGDVIALAANPRVVARLTGADPAVIRAVARTAASPAELPPAPELLEALAAAIGLEGADHGWEGT